MSYLIQNFSSITKSVTINLKVKTLLLIRNIPLIYYYIWISNFTTNRIFLTGDMYSYVKNIKSLYFKDFYKSIIPILKKTQQGPLGLNFYISSYREALRVLLNLFQQAPQQVALKHSITSAFTYPYPQKFFVVISSSSKKFYKPLMRNFFFLLLIGFGNWPKTSNKPKFY